jgi:hypothetical protein
MLTVKVLGHFQQNAAARAFELDRAIGGIEMVRAGDSYYEAGAGGRMELKGTVYIQIIGFNSGLLPLKRDTGLRQDRTGITGRGMTGKLDDIEVEEVRGLVPDNMVDGLIAIGDVFNIAGVDGRYNGFVTDNLNPESRMRKEDDDRVGGMDMGSGGIVNWDLTFQQPEVRVYLDDLVVGLAANGELGLQSR